VGVVEAKMEGHTTGDGGRERGWVEKGGGSDMLQRPSRW
jgi:hypothetical protein